MPIIPRADTSQILNAGSPVAISGTGEAALGFQAMDQLGQAMMKVGAKLSQVEELTNRQRTTIGSEVAASRFEIELSTLAEEIKSDPSYLDIGLSNRKTSTPKNALKLFQERAAQLKQKFGSNIGNDAVSAMYGAKAEKLISDEAIKFYAGAVKDYANANKIELERLVSINASSIFNSPDKVKALSESVARIQTMVNSADYLNNTEKYEASIKYRKELANGMINGYLSAIATNPSLLERKRLAQEAIASVSNDRLSVILKGQGTSGIFNAAELDKKVEDINETLWKANSRQVQEISMYESLDTKQAKKQQADAFKMYSALMLTAPDDAEGAIIEKMRLDATAGKMDPQRIDDVIKLRNNMFIPTGPIKLPADSKFREKFFNKLLEEDNPRNLVNEPLLASDPISPNVRLSLSEAAERLGNAVSKDPSIKSKIKQGIKSFEAYRSDKAYKFLGNESRLALDEAASNAKQKLFDLVTSNPSMDIEKAAKEIYTTEVKPHLEIFKGFSPVVKTQLTDLIQKRDSLIQQYTQDKKNGVMNKTLELEYKTKLLQINQSIQSVGGE